MFVPISFTKAELEGFGNMYNHGVIARLRPGVTVAQAQAEAAAVMKHISDELYPAELRQSGLHRQARR